MDLQCKEWNNSYQNKDNFVFYPHEEIIRFTSKYIRKRTGYREFINIHSLQEKPKILDAGCGLGRHMIFFHEFGLAPYGIDLSSVAIKTAQDIFTQQGIPHLRNNLYQGSITSLPFADNFFDFAISHGVLDSMNFTVAIDALKDLSRCLKPDAYFYIDLISGDDLDHYPEFRGEETVDTQHEHGTVQSYFNWSKILELVDGQWTIAEAFLVKRKSLISSFFHSRYHLGLKNHP